MKIRNILMVALLSLATQAFANHCPADMKKIDEALAKKPSISSEQLAEVKLLRTKGEEQHKAGKHGESVESLGKAMKILGIN